MRVALFLVCSSLMALLAGCAGSPKPVHAANATDHSFAVDLSRKWEVGGLIDPFTGPDGATYVAADYNARMRIEIGATAERVAAEYAAYAGANSAWTVAGSAEGLTIFTKEGRRLVIERFTARSCPASYGDRCSVLVVAESDASPFSVVLDEVESLKTTLRIL